MYLGSWSVGDVITFYANTHTASTGAAADADAVPTYRIYENEASAIISSGSMAKLDDAGTLGFYSEEITLSSASGYEAGKHYAVYITAAVSSVTGTMHHTFQTEAKVHAAAISSSALTSLASSATAATLATSANLATLMTRVGTPSDLGGGATVAANLSDIEAQTDDIGAAGAGLTALASSANLATVLSRIGTPTDLGGGASLSANLVDIEAQTDDIGAAGAGLTALASSATVAALATSANLGTLISRVGVPSDLGGGASVAANLADIEAQTDDIGAAGAGLTALASSASIAALATSASLATVAGNVSSILTDTGTDIPATLTGLATSASIATLASSATAAAIKAKTDSLTFTVANQVDCNIQSVNDVAVTGDGQSGTEWGPA
jgi:hypothetical protein